MLRDACSTLGDGASIIPPRLPLPVARMDPHLRGAADPVDEREGLFPGQRGRGGVLRASQAGFFHGRDFAGVTIKGFIERLDGYMTQYRDERIKLTFGTASPNEDVSSDSWHNQRTRTPESNKRHHPDRQGRS